MIKKGLKVYFDLMFFEIYVSEIVNICCKNFIKKGWFWWNDRMEWCNLLINFVLLVFCFLFMRYIFVIVLIIIINCNGYVIICFGYLEKYVLKCNCCLVFIFNCDVIGFIE